MRFGFLAIFKDMSLGWPGMVAHPTHVLFPLFFPIVNRENLIL